MIGYGEKIKKWRIDNNLTQEELAKRWNIAPSSIAMYESEEREPRRELKIRISEDMNISIMDLFF